MSEHDAADRPGLLPPDGVAWPPEPEPTPAAPLAPDSLPTTARRPDDAEIEDWRTMSIDAPGGYHGGAGAPPMPAAALDAWSVIAFVAALLGALPWLWSAPLAPVMAIGFGLTGRRVCSLDPTKRGTRLATAAIVIGALTLGVVATRVAGGSLTLFSL